MPEYIVNSEEEPSLWYGDKYDELVRCKDCKYFEKYYGNHLGVCHNKGYRDEWGNYPLKSEGGYCDWAERKEE